MEGWGIELDPAWVTGILCVLGGALGLAALLAVYVFSTIRRVRLPPGADALTALRLTPLSVVVLLDLLDLALDFLSAPLAWIILTRLGLGPLRGVTVVESVIPGTQFIPTMTLAWLFARFVDPRGREPGGTAEQRRSLPR
jgi:hypothetical protein